MLLTPVEVFKYTLNTPHFVRAGNQTNNPPITCPILQTPGYTLTNLLSQRCLPVLQVYIQVFVFLPRGLCQCLLCQICCKSRRCSPWLGWNRFHFLLLLFDTSQTQGIAPTASNYATLTAGPYAFPGPRLDTRGILIPTLETCFSATCI